MVKILAIDDEQAILNVIEAYLKAESYEVYVALDGEQGLAAFRRYKPDLVILDIMLPKRDGLSVLQQIRRESNVYVILLTAKSEEPDRIVGLTIGADDYITKPFSPRELVARVKAVLRRNRGAQQEEHILVFKHIRIDVDKYQVWRDDELIELTALEFSLLKTLATYPSMVFTREQLLQHVWGYDFYGDERVVDAHIARIRQKLEEDPSAPQFIKTVRGVGYKFEDEAI